MQVGERNIRLVVAYNGARYHGWQRQADGLPTVQACLEAAAGRLLGHPVTVVGAGRTDAGVHALGQVANLHTTNRCFPLERFRRALDSALPKDIAVRSAEEVPAGFHASLWAVEKTYRYRIFTAPTKPIVAAGQVYHFRGRLDPARMVEAARRLVGEHDFRGFASAGERRANTVRTLTRCEVSEHEQEVHVTVTGNGFLYKMVRNIAGTLVEIGRRRWSPGRIDEVLASGDRKLAGPTAPAEGLWLMSVRYPENLSDERPAAT